MTDKNNSEIQLFDISAAVNYVLDEHKSICLRAVRLYEMQIAIAFGAKLNNRQSRKKINPQQWLSVPRGVMGAARVCSSIRLLQYIASYRSAAGIHQFNLLDNQDARDIIQGMLLTPDGLKKIATAARPRNLSARLKNRRRQQRRYAPLYDISLRFEPVEGSKLKGGWSTAARIFDNKPDSVEYATVRRYYKGLRGRTAAYSKKDDGDFLAGFVWLRHFGGGQFRPRDPKSAGFASRLLAQSRDTQGLTRILGQYEFVRGHLEQRGYKLLALGSNQPIAPVRQPIRPLPQELLDAIL